MDKIPLNYEASEGDTHKQTTSTLPPEVVQCLEDARFYTGHYHDYKSSVAKDDQYRCQPPRLAPGTRLYATYLTTSSTFIDEIGSSHRPPTSQRRMSGGSPGPEHRSSLASLLLNLNSSAMSSISATIGGAARLAPTGSEEEKYYTQQHLENNTFEEGPNANELFRQQTSSSDGQASHFVAGEQVRVIIVDIKEVRISDWKGTVRDWAVVPETMVNGTS